MNQNLNTPSQYVHPPTMCAKGTSGVEEVGSDDNRQPTSDEVSTVVRYLGSQAP